MRRPRRIFRGSGRATRGVWLGGGLPAVVAGLAVIGVASLVVLTGSPGPLFGRAPLASGTISADPPAVAVIDGDTLLLHGTVVRLQGVLAPRRGQACRGPDGTGYDCGNAAAAALGRLVRGQPVACRLDGRDPHGLAQGQCDAGGTPVNRAIVAAGWARAAGDEDGRGDPALLEQEQQARAAMRGVWRAQGDPFL